METVEVLGTDVADPTACADPVGALIEAPALVPGLSAWTSLVSLARLRGLPLNRAEVVLGSVGLLGCEPVRRCSLGVKHRLGMKQRPGIAAAPLDPDLLILDQPTNGRDPAHRPGHRPLITRRISLTGDVRWWVSALPGLLGVRVRG